MADAQNAAVSYVEKTRQYFADYYQRNREKKLAYARQQLAERRDAINARRRERARAKGVPAKTSLGLGSAEDKTQYNKKYHAAVKVEKNLVDKYRALHAVSKTGAVECGCCGETDLRVLTVNHKNGDGRQETQAFGALRKRILSGERAVDDLEVLCFNCNIRYEYVRGRSRLPDDWEGIVSKLKDGTYG